MTMGVLVPAHLGGPLMTVGVLVPAHLGGPLNGCCCCILYSASEFMFASFSCDVRSSVCDK